GAEPAPAPASVLGHGAAVGGALCVLLLRPRPGASGRDQGPRDPARKAGAFGGGLGRDLPRYGLSGARRPPDWGPEPDARGAAFDGLSGRDAGLRQLPAASRRRASRPRRARPARRR